MSLNPTVLEQPSTPENLACELKPAASLEKVKVRLYPSPSDSSPPTPAAVIWTARLTYLSFVSSAMLRMQRREIRT